MSEDQRSVMREAGTPTGESEFVREWTNWRRAWEGFLTAPHGWLSAVDLNWLNETPSGVRGLPGLWWQDGEALHVDPRGTAMSSGGVTFTTEQRFALAGRADDARIVIGDLEVGITRRGTVMIVTYDPRSPQRLGFEGVPTYGPDPAWVLRGTYEEFASPEPVLLDDVGGSRKDYESSGLVRVEYDGAEHALRVVRSGGVPTVLFTDATSGRTTYPACRFLNVPVADEAEAVTLDFNRALNLPCAFSDNFPICPVAPEGNRLPFAVEAGEKIPRRIAA